MKGEGVKNSTNLADVTCEWPQGVANLMVCQAPSLSPDPCWYALAPTLLLSGAALSLLSSGSSMSIVPLCDTDSRIAPLPPLSIWRTVPPVLVRNVAEMTLASDREAALLPLAKTGKK